MARKATMLVSVVTVAVLLLIGGLTWASDRRSGEHEVADVLTFADEEQVEGATARLTRRSDSLFTRVDTRDLDRRHVVTLWWVVFNHPEHCRHGEGPVACGAPDLFDGADGPTGVEPSCVYAGGSLVGGNGHARFTDRLTRGEVRDSCIDLLVDADDQLDGRDYGLTNPEGAEVHLVVRSHGPRIPGETDQQRSTFAGGCEDFLDQGATHELEPGECSDLQFALLPAGD